MGDGLGAVFGVRWALPVFSQPVPAGFPSPAEDACIDEWLDLNEHLVRHPAATFYLRASGTSMTGAGIHPGDLLIVDRSLEPADHSIVVAIIDGELTLKRLRLQDRQVWLVPENAAYAPLEVRAESDLAIWGVVTHVIHAL